MELCHAAFDMKRHQFVLLSIHYLHLGICWLQSFFSNMKRNCSYFVVIYFFKNLSFFINIIPSSEINIIYSWESHPGNYPTIQRSFASWTLVNSYSSKFRDHVDWRKSVKLVPALEFNPSLSSFPFHHLVSLVLVSPSSISYAVGHFMPLSCYFRIILFCTFLNNLY